MVVLGVTVAWAGLCNLLLELLQASDVAQNLADHVGDFAISAFVLWAVLLLLVAFTGRLWSPAAVLLAVTLALGYTNRLKLSFRSEPLYPSDLAFGQHVGFLSSVVGGRTSALLVTLVGLSVAAVLLVGRLLSRRYPRVRPRTRREGIVFLACRVAAVSLCLWLLAYASHFNVSDNRLRKAYEGTGASWVPYDQAVNYQQNGFVAGLLYNTSTPAMQKPAGYSRAVMAEIADKYAGLASETNADRDQAALDEVNVVVVLSESFSDPTRLKGVRVSEDPIPFTRALARHTASGTMLAQGIGGGTANMEFEALTGMSMREFSPQMQIPYQMLVPEYTSFPSAVGYFASHGHDSVAVHPFNTSMYKRSSVYPILGFDKTVFESSMQSRRKSPGSQYISDAAAFDEVEHQIASEDKPLLVNLVTMQNHLAYRPVPDEPFGVEGVPEDIRPTARAYLRGLRASDDALRDFVGRLRQSDEKTVVLLYGDHLPGFWPADVHEANGETRMHETPFLLWSNYKRLASLHVAVTSPTHFLPLVLDSVGAPLPPYYALLDAVAREAPAVEGETMLAPDGTPLHVADLSASAREVLHDYRLVQYDLSVGRRYSLRSMFYDRGRTSEIQSASQ